MFLTVFHCFSPLQYMPKSESLPLLFAPSFFFKKQRKWFPVVALYKRAKVRKSLFTKEQRSNLLFSRANRYFALLLTKKEWFAKNQRAISQPCKKPQFVIVISTPKKIEPGNHFKKQSWFSLFIIRNIC